MACLSLHFIEQIIIWCIVLGGVYALISLVIPLIIGPLGAIGSVLVQALKIILWVVVAVVAVTVVFDLANCLLAGGVHIGHIQ